MYDPTMGVFGGGSDRACRRGYGTLPLLRRRPDGCDRPSGLRVMAIEVDADLWPNKKNWTDDDTLDRVFAISRAKATEVREKLDKMTDARFNEIRDNGYVSFDGKKVPKT